MSEINEVVVGVRRFKVWRDAAAAAATQARGQAMLDQGKIMLDPQLDDHLAAITLLHEAVHASLEQSTLTAGKGIKQAEAEVDELLEEKLATWIEAFIPQLYRDNRKLFRAFIDEGTK